MFSQLDLMPFAGHRDFPSCVRTLREGGKTEDEAMEECERLRDEEISKDDSAASPTEPLPS